MPRRAKYNKQGETIYQAAVRSRIYSVPELSERSGIPYQTLHKRLCLDIGRITLDELSALVRVIGMTDEEIAGIVRKQ